MTRRGSALPGSRSSSTPLPLASGRKRRGSTTTAAALLLVVLLFSHEALVRAWSSSYTSISGWWSLSLSLPDAGGSTGGGTGGTGVPASAVRRRQLHRHRCWPSGKHGGGATVLHSTSTPFEAGLYDNIEDPGRSNNNDGGVNRNNDEKDSRRSHSHQPPSLAVPRTTRLVVGVNKYSHDASLCAADAKTGHVLFALSKERLTRRKRDGGNVAVLVESCLNALQLDLTSIETVVVNNHHHRVLPLESDPQILEWESCLRINGGAEDGYDDPENLLPTGSPATTHHEVSHHLAHAYGTCAQAPFESGLCVVADGMGESYRTMHHAFLTKDPSYTSDLLWTKSGTNNDDNDDNDKEVVAWECVPPNLPELAATSPYDYREAESVYWFVKENTTTSLSSPSRLVLTPLWKRFVPEHTPPTRHNHGFENMDSLGALYSRVSTHLFGDWNDCGKVMGLAPWAHHAWKTKPQQQETIQDDDIVRPALHENQPIVQGHLYEPSNGAIQIDRSLLVGMPLVARYDPDLFVVQQSDDGIEDDDTDSDGDELPPQPRARYDFDEVDVPATVALEAIAVAHRIQSDLETTLLDLVQHFQRKTKATNLCLAGGVALNSVANGRLSRELGFDQTFVSPYPGDDGIAVGCCAFGLFGMEQVPRKSSLESNAPASKIADNAVLPLRSKPPVWQQTLSPYLGPLYGEDEIEAALHHARHWISVDRVSNDDDRLQLMADEIASGGVVAWFHSRSELGPRALGHRSILADPRKKGLVKFINRQVKKRESFRPFAPSVLADEAPRWFDLGTDPAIRDVAHHNVSPYMSLTANVRPEKRALIPAVTHVDGSSRLQTVLRESEPLYYKLIAAFYKITNVPMVLNTSFNTLPGEPIVETPSDAVRSFLCSMGSIELLVLGDRVIRRKPADAKRLLPGLGTGKSDAACPRRTGRAEFQSSFALGSNDDEEGEEEEDDDEFDEDDDDMDNDVDAVRTLTRVRMPSRPMHHETNEWFELLDDLEGELLAVCDGKVSLNDIIRQYTMNSSFSDGSEGLDDAQILLQNVVHRLGRLYDHTLIYW